MKRVLFLVAILLFIAGCAFKPAEVADFTKNFETDNPTGSNIVAFTASSPNNYGLIVDTDTDESNVQGVIYVYFDDFITTGTVSGCFTFTEENDAADVNDLTTEYERDLKRVKFTAEFDDDGAYLLTISADDFASVTGSFLDGNGNGLDDGSPYDDILLQFYTGTGFMDFQDHTNPQITGFGPKTGQIGLPSTFYIEFSEPLDSALVVANVGMFRKSDDRAVSNDSLTGITMGGTRFNFQIPDDLSDIETYYVLIDCEAIYDMDADNKNMLLPPGWDYVSGITTYSFEFMTARTDPDDDDTPPAVASVSNNGDHVKIDFTEEMNPSMLTNSNIIVMAFYDGRYTVVDAEYIIDDDNEGLIVPLINALSNDISVIVKKEVQDMAGFELDSNGNGIGGEVEDQNRYYYTDSDDYIVYL